MVEMALYSSTPLSRRLSIERLMRPLAVIVMHELFNPFACARPTAHPRIMETVDSNFKGMKPLFDEVSVGVVHLTVQP